MKVTLLSVFIQVAFGYNVLCQINIDSIVTSKNTETINGKVVTKYTPGYKEIALDLQKTITDAVNFYEKKFSKQFELKLAVLDSIQWPNEILPYGFVFNTADWIVMNTGMEYGDFKKVYGLEKIHQQLDKQIEKEGIDSKEIIASFYAVYSIHELGHYYITSLSNVHSPDRWTSEFIATYLSYEFFEGYSPTHLRNFELFNGIHRDFLTPRYSSIKDFNEIFVQMGVENYLWYHSNFYFLVKTIFSCYEKRFISYYENLFPKDSANELTTDEIINLLDRDCDGRVRNWVEKLESVAEN